MIEATIEEIREMQTHSSSVVAVRAARALEELLDREFASVADYRRALERNAGALRRANPSHASLHNAMREVVTAVEAADPTDVAAAREHTRAAIEDVVERVEEGKRRAAEHAAERLSDGDAVYTHDYSTTVIRAVETAAREGRELSVTVSEARPRFLGRRTARRLADVGGVETKLAVDSAWGELLGDCDAVYVGMDCVVGDTLYNRVGTFPLCATAAELGVPVYAVGSGAKVIEDGFAFENDHRSPTEVMREPAEGFAIENPAYDATPVRLLAGVITDAGLREVADGRLAEP